VVYIELAGPCDHVAGDSFGEMILTAVSDLYSPVSGEVIRQNER